VAYKPKKNLSFRPIEDLAFPREVQIQTHTICNARCIMCPYEEVYKKISHGRMTRRLFERIIDECAEHKVEQLKPFLMNEPLLDRRLPDFIRYARKRLSAAIIGFSTNAQLLEGRLAEDLLSCGLNDLWVNFNGNTRTTYETIMRGLSFERAKRNVIDFKQRAVQSGAEIRIFTSTVETKPALAEYEASRAFWLQYDIPVVTTPLNNRGGNLKADGLKVLGSIKDRRVCDRPFYKIYIAYNGDVILCSSDWERSTIVGNVESDGIQGVWHSDNQKAIRDLLLSREWGKLPLCQQCDYIAIYA
jgi:radical SAM protein with 4Fe4S-binding SPASM domain